MDYYALVEILPCYLHLLLDQHYGTTQRDKVFALCMGIGFALPEEKVLKETLKSSFSSCRCFYLLNLFLAHLS